MPTTLTRVASAALSSVVGVALVSTGAIATSAVRGPDVSRYQHPHGYTISWTKAKGGGASFAFVKATESTNYTNAYFRRDFAALRSAGMVRGAYHFARPRSSAVSQARHFVAVAGTLRAAGDLPPVLDLERTDGLKPRALISWTHAYLNEVQRLTGRKPMIYTYPAFWRSSMANSTAFKSYPLWIATWGPKPHLVGGWSRYTFWQYTDKGHLSGVSTRVDMSVFNGSLAALRTFARAKAATPGKRFVPKVTATLSTSSVKRHSSVTLKGSTNRSLSGEKLYRQGYWSGTWHNWATTTVSRTGSYRFTVRPTVKAVNRYRVYVRATGKHTAAASRTVTLRVT